MNTTQKTTQIKLDWKAYFRAFDEAHGGDPVNYGFQEIRGRKVGGWLLWRDGWRYDRKNYAGPEYPPPDHPLEAIDLRAAYWVLRRRNLVVERNRLAAMASSIKALGEVKSAPLQERVTYRTEAGEGEETKVISETRPVDPLRLEADHEHAASLVEECDRELAQLAADRVLAEAKLIEVRDEETKRRIEDARRTNDSEDKGGRRNRTSVRPGRVRGRGPLRPHRRTPPTSGDQGGREG